MPYPEINKYYDKGAFITRSGGSDRRQTPHWVSS